MHFLRQPADVVMALDHLRRIAADGDALDHVGIKRALREKLVTRCWSPAIRCRSSASNSSVACLKDSDEFVADDLSFLLRIGDAASFRQETLGGVDVFQSDVKIFAENALHHFFLARAEQSVVDEDAGELVADRLVQERRRRPMNRPRRSSRARLSRRRPAARTRCAGFLDERAHRPIHRAVADVIDEILQDLFAARRVRDFGMKLQAVKLSRCGSSTAAKGEPSVRADGAKTLRQRGHFVAMAVPDIELRAESVEQAANRSLICSMPAPYSRRPLNTT